MKIYVATPTAHISKSGQWYGSPPFVGVVISGGGRKSREWPKKSDSRQLSGTAGARRGAAEPARLAAAAAAAAVVSIGSGGGGGGGSRDRAAAASMMASEVVGCVEALPT